MTCKFPYQKFNNESQYGIVSLHCNFEDHLSLQLLTLNILQCKKKVLIPKTTWMQLRLYVLLISHCLCFSEGWMKFIDALNALLFWAVFQTKDIIVLLI